MSKLKWKKTIDFRLMGLSAYFPCATSDSPSRAAMTLSQFSAYVPIIKPEVRTVLSGFEKEFAKANLKTKLPPNVDILYKIPYEVNDNEPLEYVIIYKDDDKMEINSTLVKRYEMYDKQFGFEHKWSDDLYNLEPGNKVYKETNLTTTNSEIDGIHAFGVQANVAWTTSNDGNEDACKVSESYCKRNAFYIYNKHIINIDKRNIPLNLYGDNKVYKIIPDVGEKIRDDGIIAATRTLDDKYRGYLANFSIKDLQIPDPDMDKVYYTKMSGGEVIDIDVFYSNPRNNAKGFKHTFDQIERYATARKHQRTLINDAIMYIVENYPDYKIGNDLYSLSTNSLKKELNNVNFTHNKDKLPIWRVEITVRHLVIPTVNYKITNQHGGKVEIGRVVPDDEMLVDPNGVRADIEMYGNAIIDRMNLGATYEGELAYIVHLFTRNFKEQIDKELNGITLRRASDDVIVKLYKEVVEFMSHFQNDRSRQYKAVLDNNDVSTMRKILHTIKEDQLRIIVDHKDDHVAIVKRLNSSKYRPKTGPAYNPKTGKYTTTDMRFNNLYIMLLDKLGTDYLACNSNYINPLSVPIAPNKSVKDRLPASYAPTKVFSETETQLFQSFLGVDFIPTMRERYANPNRQRIITKHMLEADNPFDVDEIIPRDKYPREPDVPVKAFKSIIRTYGNTIDYLPNN